MRKTLTFGDVASTRWGRFKLWCHFHVVTPLVRMLMSSGVGIPLWKASRRWVFGPNANNEDLVALLRVARRRMRRRR